jgi:hypothetical protein
VIGVGGRNNPGKKHRDPTCGASTLRNRWSFGIEPIRPVHGAPPFLLQAGARWRLSVTGAWAEPLPMMVHGALITARSLCHVAAAGVKQTLRQFGASQRIGLGIYDVRFLCLGEDTKHSCCVQMR